MRLKFIGTGGNSSKDRALSSFLINDEILFDIGADVKRRLQELKIEDGAIRTLVISHFHGDHAAGLSVWLFRRKVRSRDVETLTVITPRGGRREIIARMKMDYDIGDPKKWKKIEEELNLEVIELSNSSERVGEAEYFAYDANHTPGVTANCVAICVDGTTIGFSGDSLRCKGLDRVVEMSELCLLDASGLDGECDHLGVNGVLEYAEQYPEKKFYLVHRADYEVDNLPGNVFMPDDGEEAEL
jgi:ribonuclease BN (tRNA processing enzyme)